MVIKLFSCFTKLSMKSSLLINMKMPMIVDIFIFIYTETFSGSAMFSKKKMQLLAIWDLLAGQISCSFELSTKKVYKLGARICTICHQYCLMAIMVCLTFTTLWAFSADDKLMIFFLFFPENWIWHFMQIVSLGDNLSPWETVCMKCQILFSGKNKKNILKCRLLQILPRVLSIKH